jgi:hypothetical protein
MHAVSSIRTPGLEENKPNEPPRSVIVYLPDAGPFVRGCKELTKGIEKLNILWETPIFFCVEPTITTKPPTLLTVLIKMHESEIQPEEDMDENDTRTLVETPGFPIDEPNNSTLSEPVDATEPGLATITANLSYEANVFIINGLAKV